MLKNTFFFVALGICASTNLEAQTKQETENWILEKLEKYSTYSTLKHYKHYEETGTEKYKVKSQAYDHALGFKYYGETEECTLSRNLSNFRFEDGYLKFDIKGTVYKSPTCLEKTEQSKGHENFNLTWKIPLNDFGGISSFERTDDSWYWVTPYTAAYKPHFLRISNLSKSINNGDLTDLTSSVTFEFDFDREANLLDRLKKAFTFLKQFYPKAKEIF